MKRAIVVGSGAGGAAAARKLQDSGLEVTVLEAGGAFKPFSWSLDFFARLRATGLFFDERQIQLFFPAMKVQRARTETGGPRLVLVSGRGLGGTTVLSTGNALRMDGGLKKLGIDLEEEFAELGQEVPITQDHRHLWHDATIRMFERCRSLGLEPEPLPKMGRYQDCRSCGRCVLGCPHGVKWDSRSFLVQAVSKGAYIKTGWQVMKVVIEGGRAKGVVARSMGGRRRFFPAELVVLAAGGMQTPVILQRSGIACRERFFVDPVLCVAARRPGSFQNREVPMLFGLRQDRALISPYFDFVSFFFNRAWRWPAQDLVGIMIKLADDPLGSVSPRGVSKPLTPGDEGCLAKAVDLCREILAGLGIDKQETFLGTLNAGHPGGGLPLTEQEARTLHPAGLPDNLAVADATLLPESLGSPPILTIMALAAAVVRAGRTRLGW